MPFGGALLIGGTAGLGAIAGSQKDKSDQTYGVNLGPESDLQKLSESGVSSDYTRLRQITDSMDSNINAGLDAQKDYAAMLGDFSKGGFLPGTQDFSNANTFAQQAFAPQQVALQQAFQDQTINANRQAALMGRQGNDPILQAKLALEQTRQQAMLNAQQGSFATQYAQQMPAMRLGYAGQRADVLGGLASQALANRQALASMGSSILGNERNWQYQTAQHYGHQESGGGLKGAIEGGLAGASMGMNMVRGMGAMPGAMPSTPTPSSGANYGQLSGLNYSAPPSQFFNQSYGATPLPMPSSYGFGNSYTLGR